MAPSEQKAGGGKRVHAWLVRLHGVGAVVSAMYSMRSCFGDGSE